MGLAGLRFLIFVPLALCSFVSVLYIGSKLLVFLSWPQKIPIEQVWIVNLLDDWSRFESTLLPLTTNGIWTVLFILLHSPLKSAIARKAFTDLKLSPVRRSIYNLLTAASLSVSRGLHCKQHF